MMYTILISQPEKNFHVNLSSEYYWGSVSRRVEVVEAVLVVVASDDKSINWCFCCFSVRKVNSWFTITWRSADPASLLLLASTWKVLKSSRITNITHTVILPDWTLKNGASLILPSSIVRNSSAPNAKIIFEILWGILEGRTKGQLISECLFEKTVWTKIPTKNLMDSAQQRLLLQGQYKKRVYVLFART